MLGELIGTLGFVLPNRFDVGQLKRGKDEETKCLMTDWPVGVSMFYNGSV